MQFLPHWLVPKVKIARTNQWIITSCCCYISIYTMFGWCVFFLLRTSFVLAIHSPQHDLTDLGLFRDLIKIVWFKFLLIMLVEKNGGGRNMYYTMLFSLQIMACIVMFAGLHFEATGVISFWSISVTVDIFFFYYLGSICPKALMSIDISFQFIFFPASWQILYTSSLNAIVIEKYKWICLHAICRLTYTATFAHFASATNLCAILIVLYTVVVVVR